MNRYLVLSSLTSNDLKAATFKKADAYQRFLNTHYHASHYAFQLKKCKDPNCYYCLKHPIRLPQELFNTLHFLPLPLLDYTKQHFKKFEDLYGTDPLDVDRPSCIPTPTPSEEAKELDKTRKSFLVCGRLRSFIICVQ